MSRSGYTDECDDQWGLIRWRGAVASATKGARGQAMLRELLAALDAMPEKRLVAQALEADGEFCTLGVLGKVRGIDLASIDPEDYDAVAAAFGVAPALVREIVFENDETIVDHKWAEFEVCGPMRPSYPDWGRHDRSRVVDDETAPERRWQYMRAWVASQIKAPR